MLTPTGIDQAELVAVLKALRNRTFTDPGLAVGSTTASRVRFANTVQFAIDGVNYSAVAQDNVSVGTMTALAATEACRIRVEINSAGTLNFVQGKRVTGARGTAPTPLRTASRCTLGVIDVAGAFTFGTTTFAAETYIDGDPDLAPNGASDKQIGLEA